MKKLFILIIIILTLTFVSCSPCSFLDCISSNYSLSFRIVSVADGTDLVFGRKRIYDRNLFRFYSLKGIDTTFYALTCTGYYLNAPEDSVMHIQFYPMIDTAYMRLSNGDIDTPAMSFNTYKTKCCGTITDIINFRLNDKIDLPGNKGTQIIKK